MKEISEIQIIPIKPKDGLIGFASLVFEGIYLSSIGIHKKINGSGYRITFPTKKVGEKQLNIFHPINREIGLEIEKSILKKTEEIFK